MALTTSKVHATIGATFVIFACASLSKLVVSLGRNSDFSTALHAVPPRDAFAGKVFWITGASSGLGRALTLRLCSEHDNVKLILSSRRKDALEKVAVQCKENGAGRGIEATVLTLDLADHASLPSKAEEALSVYGGRVDVLVNNGGMTTRSMARNSDFDVDVHVMNVDFLSYVALTKSLLPSWEGQYANVKGNADTPIIINTSSVAGRFGVPVRTAYCGAKFAIQGWFDAFRLEQDMIGKPIDVLNVVLGSTRTDVARNAIVDSPGEKFGKSDVNIEAGLDPEFVVERVLASAHARRREMWIAPRKELLMLYLNQYIPEIAYSIMSKKGAKEYAIERRPDDDMEGKGGEL